MIISVKFAEFLVLELVSAALSGTVYSGDINKVNPFQESRSDKYELLSGLDLPDVIQTNFLSCSFDT